MTFLVVRGLLGFLLVILVLCSVFQCIVEGGTKEGTSKVKCTTKTDRCCKLGRKAARHHLISPFYTCHYEALIAALDHKASVANRMRLTYRGRLKYTKTIVRTTAFRSRLAWCYLPRNKKCFESCCATKRKALIKASKHVLATPAPRNITETPKI